jgi:threonine dehydrogenase-like Zn-dependent dehydrogenase
VPKITTTVQATDADDDTGLSFHDVDTDIVMRHAYCAEIVDYGPGTARRWPAGTRVTSLPVLFTGGPVRVVGQSAESPGGFGEYFLMSKAVTQVVPTRWGDSHEPH